MPAKTPEDSQVVSLRLPQELIRRLDRCLDWSELYRGNKSSRNAALREALSYWLDDQEQIAGFLDPQVQQQQFYHAYHSLDKRQDWVAIDRLRQLMPWPRERFDAVVESLRAESQVELERAAPGEMSEQVLQESYQVHGQFYHRLRWRRSQDHNRADSTPKNVQ